MGELARYTARATIPPELGGNVDVADDVPMIHGHHDALARALSNVMLNAVDACKCAADSPERWTFASGARTLRAAIRSRSRCRTPGAEFRATSLARIWDPYVTSKPGGTGLGLAIARQTVLAHDGAVSADSVVGVGN